MAIIKMDVSEYEEMKKNARLLERALKKEESLNEEIKKLQQEKIDIMEQNKKSVTIIKELHQVEVKSCVIPDTELIPFLNHMLNKGSYGYYGMGNSLGEVLTEKLFRTDRFATIPQDSKKVVYKGLDEVIEKIKKELKEALDQGVKQDLERLEKLSEAFYKLEANYKEQSKTLSTISEVNKAERDDLNKKVKITGKTVEVLREDLRKVEYSLTYIEELVNQAGWNNRKSIIKRIKKELNK